MLEDNTTPSAEEILDEVVKGAEAHNAAAMVFRESFQFYGKSLNDWLNEMAIELPKELTPMVLQELYLDVAKKYQRAANFYTISNSVYGGIADGGNIKKSDLVKTLVERYKASSQKRPGQDIIEHMASSYLSKTMPTRIAAKIVRDFWKERKDAIVEVRKCLEQASISIATELKYTG